MDLWQEREALVGATANDIATWQEDIIRMAATDEWKSLRKYLLLQERRILGKVYSPLPSTQESQDKLLGRAGAFQEVLALPQQLIWKRDET